MNFSFIKSTVSSSYNQFNSTILSPLVSKTGVIYQKTKDIATRAFTYTFIKEKTENTIKANLLPLSNPPGWEADVAKATKDLKRHLALKNAFEELANELVQETQEIKNLPVKKQDQKRLNNLVERINSLQEKINRLKGEISADEKILAHLQKVRKLTIGGRFTRYASLLANFLVPGSGIVVGTAMTAATTVAQEQSAKTLPPRDLSQDLKSKTRLGTALSATSSAASLAARLLV